MISMKRLAKFLP